ncbi:hypothetical protein BpHYR1_053917 [Brachionus plicatilis]|uniref:Uncharacterized protein n=1 Tax=Brachionus plicatilis TaxID=10195 RepID=A0A3M7QC06_BRAPC|nr:hypothetical protein BpHYR1_053917 [Brachionus plicatilis]
MDFKKVEIFDCLTTVGNLRHKASRNLAMVAVWFLHTIIKQLSMDGNGLQVDFVMPDGRKTREHCEVLFKKFKKFKKKVLN